MREPADDPRDAFVRNLPRKIVEIKASLGALIADSGSLLMRDELRRRIHAVHALARSYQLPSFCLALQGVIEVLDAPRSTSAIARPQIDRLATLVASLPSRVESDVRGPTATSDVPVVSGTRSEVSQGRTILPPAGQPRLSTVVPLEVETIASALATARQALEATDRLRKALPSPEALQVLLCVGEDLFARVRECTPSDIDLVVAASTAEALTLARETAPDAVLVEVAAPFNGLELLQALRADPITDFLPIILVAQPGASEDELRASARDAFDVLSSTVDALRLRQAIEKATRGSSSQSPPSVPDLGTLTLDELTSALQSELRRGLVGAASPKARTARIAFGPGSDILAATWEAIARIRDAVQRRSHGEVRFDFPATPRGLPGTEVFTVADDRPSPHDQHAGTADDPLPGRSALVVDDDPKVIEQFTGLLRDAGMFITSCTSGTAALELARKELPDIVLADILMPGLDGYGLCRAIRADVVLRHTPVVLLSWREDLLHRVRQLGARAQGYLRKEAAGDAVLARIRTAIRNRVRALRRVELVGPGETARGRLERVGLVALLEAVARALRDATVTLADSTSVTELEIRGGTLVSALRTAQDGALARGDRALLLARGDRALLLALGLQVGRFTVSRNSGHARVQFRDALGALLRRCATRVAAVEGAVSGAALLDVARVDLDPDGAIYYAKTLPAPLRQLVERLAQGDAPRDLVLDDGVSPSELEPLLLELARRGVIQRVQGLDGQDLAMEGAPRSVVAESTEPPPISPTLTDRSVLFASVATRDATEPAPPIAPVELAPPLAPPPEAPDESERLTPFMGDILGPMFEPVPLPSPDGGTEVRFTVGPIAENEALATLAQAVWRELASPVSSAESGASDGGTWGGGDAVFESVPPRGSSTPPVTGRPAKVISTAPDSLPLPDVPEFDHDPSRDPIADTRVVPQALMRELRHASRVAPSHDAPPPSPPPPVPTSPPPSVPTSPPAPERAYGEIFANDPDTGDIGAPTEGRPSSSAPAPRSFARVRIRAATPSPPMYSSEPDGEGIVLELRPRAVRSSPPSPSAPPREEAVETPSSEGVSVAEALAGALAATTSVTDADDAPSTPLTPSDLDALKPGVHELDAPDPLLGDRYPLAVMSPLRLPPPPPVRSRAAVLVLGVAAAFASSYVLVRWFVAPPPTVQPEVGEVDPPSDARAAVAPDSRGGLDAEARVAVAARDASTGSARRDDPAAATYRDPAGLVDPGQTIAPGHGLLVVSPPPGGESTVEVSVDQRPAVRCPLRVELSEGLHTLRYRSGANTSYQFATVRPGLALVLAAPSDQ